MKSLPVKCYLGFAACILLASYAFAGEVAMVRLHGTPVEIGRAWGEINKRAIRHDIDVHYLKKAAAAGISEDALLERSKAFVQIVQQIAPHWLEEARAVAQAAGVREDLYLAFLGGKPRNLFLHECTSYAVAGERADGKAIFFHKTRDNADREQAAYILDSSLTGIHKFIAVCDASAIGCSMMVNDQGLAGAGDYPAHLTRKGDPTALLPEAAKPQYRGMMGGSILRYIAERRLELPGCLGDHRGFREERILRGGRREREPLAVRGPGGRDPGSQQQHAPRGLPVPHREGVFQPARRQRGRQATARSRSSDRLPALPRRGAIPRSVSNRRSPG